MQEIIGTKNIRIHYQPIKHLQSGLTVGGECLARGPQGSELENPVALFDCAERIGCLFELEQICRTQSIRNVKVEPTEKLFINISPSIFSDLSFREGETRTVLEEYECICEISRGFGGMTIAEGIETQDELDCILSYGVDYGQGYLFGRPQPLVDSVLTNG